MTDEQRALRKAAAPQKRKEYKQRKRQRAEALAPVLAGARGVTSAGAHKKTMAEKGIEIIHTNKGNFVVERDAEGKIINKYKNVTGRPRESFTSEQKLEFLGLIDGGAGRALALHTMKATESTLKRTFEDDPEFKSAVVLYEKTRTDRCELQIYNSALNGNISSAGLYIKLRADRVAQQAAINSQKHELKLKEQMIAQQAGIPGFGAARPNLAALGRQSFEDFSNLHTKVVNGIDLTDQECMNYGYYIAKILNPKNAGERLREGEVRELPAPQNSEKIS